MIEGSATYKYIMLCCFPIIFTPHSDGLSAMTIIETISIYIFATKLTAND